MATGLQTVDRAGMVLAYLRDHPATRPPSISSQTGLDRAVVHRVLRSLSHQGLVTNWNGEYAIGPAAMRLGQAFIDRHPGRRALLPYAIDLHSRLGNGQPWIVSISLPAGDMAVIVERVWGPGTPLPFLLDVGNTFPIDETASGRSLLAAFSDSTVSRLVGVSRAARVQPDLDAIRGADGLSIAHGDLAPEMSAIAIAIGDEPAQAASLVVAGINFSDQANAESSLAFELRQIAHAASRALSTKGEGFL